MLDGLPDRPLFEAELEAFTESEAIKFVFPATPESMDTDDEGRSRIYDLLLFLPASVAVLAYEGEGEGWIVVANESGNEPYRAAVDALIDHRDYELFEGHAAVGHGDLRRPIDVLTELGVYLVGVHPCGDWTLTSGEDDTTDVLTPDFSVLVVGTRTPSLTSVHTVL